MLVVSRKNGQKIMINDNIVITVVECRNGQCKIAIDADKDVKIYREEIYYQIKLANLIGKDTNIKAVNDVSNMIQKDNLELNDKMNTSEEVKDIQIDQETKSKKIIIKKNTPKDI